LEGGDQVNPILRFLFGLEKDETPLAGESHWEFAGMPEGSWLWFAVLIVGLSALLIIALYRREAVLSTPRRATLVFLRLAALTLIVLILLNPKMITEIQVVLPGKALVLIDTSASMDQRDSYEGSDLSDVQSLTERDGDSIPTRGEIALAALNAFNILPRLEENNRVHLYTFGEQLSEVSSLDDIEPASFKALETRIGNALTDLFDHHAADPVSSVILLSDGRDNHTVHPLELVRDWLTRKRVPIHALGIGKSEDLKNFAVLNLKTPQLAEVGFPVQIESSVRLAGIRGPVRISLYRDDKLLEHRDLEGTGGDEITKLKFIDTIHEKGNHRYSLRIPHHPEEETTRDNRQDTVVAASDQEYRVLLVSGDGTPEYKKLRNFILRDNGILASCFLMNADPTMPQDGDVVIAKLPESEEDLGDYDVVVLLDPDPEAISRKFVRGLTKFVSEEGGGLIYIAGDIHTHRLGSTPHTAKLLDLIPARLQGTTRTKRQVHDKAWQPRLTPSGIDHPLCRLTEGSTQNIELWKVLPPFYYSYAATKLKPAAISLVRNAKDHIIFAWQQSGRGESLYLGSDDFHEWGTVGRRFPELFWAGLVRYLAEARRAAGIRRTHLETDRDRYRERDRVAIHAHVADTSATHVPSPFLVVRVERLGSDFDAKPGTPPSVATSTDASQTAQIRLHPVTDEPGRYRGFFHPEKGGDYALRLENEEKIISVRASSSERNDPTPDFALLEELADASDGEFLSWEELRSLPDRISNASQRKIVGRRVATLWDSAALMILFCAFLIAEWILRKLWQLN
jgi:hypothetical protein